MSNRPYNEPAFPNPLINEPGAYEAAPGMTMRDYFAAAALTGFIANSHTTIPELVGNEDAATELAYRIADAMLAEREE